MEDKLADKSVERVHVGLVAVLDEKVVVEFREKLFAGKDVEVQDVGGSFDVKGARKGGQSDEAELLLLGKSRKELDKSCTKRRAVEGKDVHGGEPLQERLEREVGPLAEERGNDCERKREPARECGHVRGLLGRQRWVDREEVRARVVEREWGETDGDLAHLGRDGEGRGGREEDTGRRGREEVGDVESWGDIFQEEECRGFLEARDKETAEFGLGGRERRHVGVKRADDQGVDLTNGPGGRGRGFERHGQLAGVGRGEEGHQASGKDTLPDPRGPCDGHHFDGRGFGEEGGCQVVELRLSSRDGSRCRSIDFEGGCTKHGIGSGRCSGGGGGGGGGGHAFDDEMDGHDVGGGVAADVGGGFSFGHEVYGSWTGRDVDFDDKGGVPWCLDDGDKVELDEGGVDGREKGVHHRVEGEAEGVAVTA